MDVRQVGPPSGCAQRVQGTVSTLEIRGQVVELDARVRHHKVSMLVDSGATGCFFLSQMVTECGLRTLCDSSPEHLLLADGTEVRTEGVVLLEFYCGSFSCVVWARVFPMCTNNVY